MAKKKKSTQVSWCWYCDREFEDDKVLLQHQKAKHFRCSHCPRRLNTAGGLAVHIDQVHKLGTEQIENALPGRTSFDVEIYGMEGIPSADLAAWKKRRAETTGEPIGNNGERIYKKPRIQAKALTTEEVKIMLEAHKKNMGIGQNVVAAPLPFAMGGPFVPGPFGLPPGMPPPPPGVILPPGMPFPPPGALLNFPFPLPNLTPIEPILESTTIQSEVDAPVVLEKMEKCSVEIKDGAVLVYGDELSPEEKRAKLSQYKVDDSVKVEQVESTKRPRAAEFSE